MDFREFYVIEEMKVAMETRRGKEGVVVPADQRWRLTNNKGKYGITQHSKNMKRSVENKSICLLCALVKR